MKNILHDELLEFYSIWKETDAIYRKLAKRSNLSESGYWVFYAVYENKGHCTQKDICDQWSLSKQTVNSALKELEKKGCITLEVSESDRRSKYIVLTNSGRELAGTIIDTIFKLEESTWMKMDEAERTAMLQSSRKYLEIFRKETAYLCK